MARRSKAGIAAVIAALQAELEHDNIALALFATLAVLEVLAGRSAHPTGDGVIADARDAASRRPPLGPARLRQHAKRSSAAGFEPRTVAAHGPAAL
jgi:hypothetical protein